MKKRKSKKPLLDPAVTKATKWVAVPLFALFVWIPIIVWLLNQASFASFVGGLALFFLPVVYVAIKLIAKFNRNFEERFE